jgi:membrane protein implicated in regulation of membrane protease activity
MISGMIINFGLTMLIFGVTIGHATGATAIFFVVSFARSYLIRRWFRRNENETL